MSVVISFHGQMALESFMRELTTDELSYVVGGGPPLENPELPGGEDWPFLDDFYATGYGVAEFGIVGDLVRAVEKVWNDIFNRQAAQDKAFMDHCAAQGKTAVFNEAGGGVSVSVDPNRNKIEIKGSTNGTSRHCAP